MADISRSRVISTPQQAIWDVLADFGALSSWADDADHSCLLTADPDGPTFGTTRRVQMGRLVLIECIVEFDPPAALAYDITGLPARLRHVTNRWALRPSGDSTTVTLTSRVEIGANPFAMAAEALVVRVMAKQSDSLLAGLARHLERSRG